MENVANTEFELDVGKSEQAFNIEMGRGNESHNFVINKENFKNEKPLLVLNPLCSGQDGIIQGCLDRDGKIFWINDDKVFPRRYWEGIIGSPPVSLFEYNPVIKRFFVDFADLPAAKATLDFAKKSGLAETSEIMLTRLGSMSNLGSGLRYPKFIGRLSNWESTTEDFVPDYEIPRKVGYENVPLEGSTQKLNELYQKARNKGKYLIVRTVGVPVEPSGPSSGSLLAPPGHTDLFDARHGDYDKGGLVYEIGEESALLNFKQDASTWLFKKEDAPQLRPDQAKIEYKDIVVYYAKAVRPETLDELHKYATSPQGERFYSEVFFDPGSDDCKLVAVINPYDVFGWSKIAYKNGAVEFDNIPEFGKKPASQVAQKLSVA